VAASALALALAAAVVHALWNLLLARAPDPEAATAVAGLVGLATFAPVAAATWQVERAAWPYIVVTGVVELAYLAVLAAAYRRAELSVVYPVARGVAPVLVLVVGVAALGAPGSGLQAAGVCLVGAGVLAVRGLSRPARSEGVAFGLAVAVCIAAYTLIDDKGVDHADPFAYLEVSMILPVLAYTAGIAVVKGTAALRSALAPATVVAGLFLFGAYGLVLTALERAPAAPVAAVRETSVVIATALAAAVLRESVTRWRVLGAALVAGGVALVSL
jgi:drug/metabolite transporter (DMT)-like permease